MASGWTLDDVTALRAIAEREGLPFDLPTLKALAERGRLIEQAERLHRRVHSKEK